MSRLTRSESALPNLLRDLPDERAGEVFENLVQRPGCRIERIVSHGQTTPDGEWWVQDWDEWVLVLAGHAGLTLEGHEIQPMAAGDYLLIPAGTRHRVEWTHPTVPTVWLAVHLGEQGGTSGAQ